MGPYSLHRGCCAVVGLSINHCLFPNKSLWVHPASCVPHSYMQLRYLLYSVFVSITVYPRIQTKADIVFYVSFYCAEFTAEWRLYILGNCRVATFMVRSLQNGGIRARALEYHCHVLDVRCQFSSVSSSEVSPSMPPSPCRSVST